MMNEGVKAKHPLSKLGIISEEYYLESTRKLIYSMMAAEEMFNRENNTDIIFNYVKSL